MQNALREKLTMAQAAHRVDGMAETMSLTEFYDAVKLEQGLMQCFGVVLPPADATPVKGQSKMDSDRVKNARRKEAICTGFCCKNAKRN